MTRPRTTVTRLLAGAAAAVAISLTASACDSSPVVATVNGQVIKQTTLLAELRNWAGDRQYVNAFDQSNTGQTLPDGLPISVEGQGGPGTYNNAWVSNILDNLIAAAAIHQHLAQTGALPDAATLAAARSVLEFGQFGWYGLSASFRDDLTQRLADQATASAPPTNLAAVRQVYDTYHAYFFTSICTTQVAAQNQAQAEAEAAGGLSSAGPQTCYDQAQFEQQSDAWRKAVLTTAVGKVAPVVPTRFGFQVIQVTSRVDQGFDAGVQQVLGTVLDSQSRPDPNVEKIVTEAHVHLNPAYGTWQPPNVQIPAVPNIRA